MGENESIYDAKLKIVESRVDKIEQRQDKTEEKLDSVEKKTDNLSNTVSKIEMKVDFYNTESTKRMDAFSEEIKEMRKDMGSMKKELIEQINKPSTMDQVAKEFVKDLLKLSLAGGLLGAIAKGMGMF